MCSSLNRAFALVLLSPVLSVQGTFAEYAFEQGDSIAIIGNALPDRMQQDGYLETYLQLANPDKQLVIRDMGFSGDEVANRPREENFPTVDYYMDLVKADVIFAFFGYNESFKQDPALFKQELATFIEETRAKRYNGESAPRLVLFSPIAHEDLQSPDFPDGKDNNKWLEIYTDAMARVASEMDVPFVDLFGPSQALYAATDAPLTINGVHLNAQGNDAIAKVIVEALGQKVETNHADLVRAAVLEKNWCWFNRYRATDGNDVWGNRSILKFVNDQSNAEVLQHELLMLDIMSANRDKVIWSATLGEGGKPDDSNVPNPIQVETNYQPSEKNGKLAYTPASEGVNTLKLATNLETNLFASEEMFPEFVNPVQMDVDTKGRIWVAVWETYPKWQPDREMLDRLVILPDENRDGIADECKTFAYVHNPTAFTFWNGGVIVASAPNFWFLKDTDGDDVADHREIILSGLDSADTHHSANGFDFGPDGYIYYQRGIFNVSNVETPWQGPQFFGNSAMYRFNPRSHRFSYHAENPPNPHGGDFDYWGYHYATDATGGRAYQVRMDGDGGFKMHELLTKTVRPVPSSGILSSTHFPEEMNGNYLILNAIGFLGIKQYTLEKTDGNVWGTETEDLLVSDDPNFRPADFKFGDDGALYVADWANALIGHMQHNIRDPSRDREHGRVYRVTYKGRPLEESVKVDSEPIPALLDVLKHPTNGVRLRARTELSERNRDEVIAAATEWAKQFDPSKAEDAHHLLEVLWLHQQFNVLNEGLLSLLLNSPEAHARRAAERVKYIWEIEGKFGESSMASMDHSAHAAHGGAADYLKQEMSPPPFMDGDTLVIKIQTLKEQMKYDRTKFAVEPGMKVRIEFSNPDAMDHNLMVLQPDSAEEVAMAAMLLGADGVKKSWTPDSPKIIAHSKTLSVGQSENIEFTAPEAIGLYDYICTYPGHWQLMRGMMHVVEDREAWDAANPDPALAEVKEWKPEDFSADLDKLASRSAARGEEIFKAAACVACHKAGGEGAAIGPDLAGVAERLDPAAMAVEMLDPSRVIKDEYKPWNIELNDLTSTYGLVLEQTDEFIRVVENPLVTTEARKIPRSEISDMTASPVSTMPTGLLGAFSKDDILDLMAYLRGVKAHHH
jgi:putative heme-binding domain-containing protein